MQKNKIINVNIIIESSRLMKDFSNPSKDQNKPTDIGSGYQFMVSSDGCSLSGQGTGDLNIAANQGDVVRFYATSEYNNYDKPIILYNLFYFGESTVFQKSNFELENFPDADIIIPAMFNPLTTAESTQNFWFAQNTINGKGKQHYGLQFVLYNSDLTLYGCFSWKPSIVAF